MNCPQCEHQIESADAICQHCGFDLSSAAWVVLTKVYPPDDLIIESLLNPMAYLIKYCAGKFLKCR